jgi:predicted metal-binding protein
MKVGIIRCQENSERCAGHGGGGEGCFWAIRNKKGSFEVYDTVELIGFDTCGGCARGAPTKILDRAQKLKKYGAEVIHLSCCMMLCPHKDIYEAAIKETVGLPVVNYTHPYGKPH